MREIIGVLKITLEETNEDIKRTIAISDDKTAVHHLHGRVKDIEEVIKAVNEVMKWT